MSGHKTEIGFSFKALECADESQDVDKDISCYLRQADQPLGCATSDVEEEGCSISVMVANAQAASLLQYLRLVDIMAFHLGSHACRKFCRSPHSYKLIVPTFFHQSRSVEHIDLPSVETMYADEIKVHSLSLNIEFAKCLQACASLKTLYCTKNIKLMVANIAPALVALTHLAVLDLSHNRLAIDDHRSFEREQILTPLISSLPHHVQVLDLSYNLLRDDHVFMLVEALTAHSGNSYLEQLLLRSNMLGNGSGFALGQLMKSPAGASLWRLDLRTNRVEAEGACAMLTALQIHPRMKEMRVGYNRQNQKQDLETARLASMLLRKALSAKSCNRLEVLDLNNVRVGDSGMKQMSMALALNTLLRRLDLAFNSIGPEGAQFLATALESNGYLESVDLRDNEVGDEGAEALAAGLQHNFSLKRLQLARNGIGGRGALALLGAVRENSDLQVDFGASGDGSAKLQTMMSRTPSMAGLRIMREAEREFYSAGAESGEQHTSLMFSY